MRGSKLSLMLTISLSTLGPTLVTTSISTICIPAFFMQINKSKYTLPYFSLFWLTFLGNHSKPFNREHSHFSLTAA